MDLGFNKQRLQLEIRASEKPFIEKDGDDIESAALAQFLWDMQYWLNSSTLPLEELVIRIGLFYYTSDIEKSNVYLIAILVKRLNASGKFDLTLQRLEELAKKPTLSGFKFFSEDTEPTEFEDEVPAGDDDPIPNAPMKDSPTLTGAVAGAAPPTEVVVVASAEVVVPVAESEDVFSSAANTATDNAIKASTNNFFILIPPFNFL